MKAKIHLDIEFAEDGVHIRAEMPVHNGSSVRGLFIKKDKMLFNGRQHLHARIADMIDGLIEDNQ